MKKLFVIMPFGVRVGSMTEHGAETIDFDAVYREIIRKAASLANWAVSRIDEVSFSGNIVDQYLRELISADAVLADVSVPNGNVYYELGIRQAVSTGPTILIAHTGTRLPFDISTQRVYFYDLNTVANTQAVDQITHALAAVTDERSTNPVQEFLRNSGTIASPERDSAAFEEDLQGRIRRASTGEQLLAVWSWAKHQRPLPPFTLLELAHRVADFGEWNAAVEILQAANHQRQNDFELRRELGWHTSKAGNDASGIEILQEALDLNPDDPETLGMLGGIYKRLQDYVRAADYYEKGARLSRSSLYICVNEAAMAILSAPASPERGIELYRKLISQTEDSDDYAPEWRNVVLGEAFFAIADDASADKHYRAAKQSATSTRSIRSAADQLGLFIRVGFRPTEAAALSQTLLSEPRAVAVQVDEIASNTFDKPSDNRAALPILLHISDIHFGRRTGPDGVSKEMHRFFDGDYSKRLSEHLLNEFSTKRAHFRFDPNRIHLLVSGDLTYTGKADEFVLVKRFLDEIRCGLALDHDRIVIVPGNHDVCWDSSLTDRTHRFDNYIGFLSSFYGEARFRAKYPHISWDLKVNTQRPGASDIMTVYHNETFAMTIAALNSCVYEDDQQHYGFIGKTQLDLLEDALRPLPSENGIRIAMFHHHLHPYPEYIRNSRTGEVEADLSTIRDAGIVERQLERLQFDLVLHGHKHKPQIRETRIHHSAKDSGPAPRGLIVCGAGSVGVDKSELEHHIPNQYQVIELLRNPRRTGAELLRIESRTLDVEPEADWFTAGMWTIRG